MDRHVLVTGGEGFIGSHLCDLLVGERLNIFATTLGDVENIRHLLGIIHVVNCDLTDINAVNKVVQDSNPEFVFHLAAQSFPTVSWLQPDLTLRSNVMGTFNLLEALRKSDCDATVVVVGSSAVYGICTSDEMPLYEDREFRPTSIYAVSKVAEEMLASFYWRVYGMKAIRVRPFNMTGPRKEGDACSDFAKSVAEIRLGIRNFLGVGNLNTVRDFTDGRDAVRALWILAKSGKTGDVYNLCSGKGHNLSEIVELFRKQLEFVVNVDPSKFRPFDDPIYVGDNSKLVALGWRPEISINDTLSDLTEYWFKRLGQGSTT